MPCMRQTHPKSTQTSLIQSFMEFPKLLRPQKDFVCGMYMFQIDPYLQNIFLSYKKVLFAHWFRLHNETRFSRCVVYRILTLIHLRCRKHSVHHIVCWFCITFFCERPKNTIKKAYFTEMDSF